MFVRLSLTIKGYLLTYLLTYLSFIYSLCIVRRPWPVDPDSYGLVDVISMIPWTVV